MITLNIADLVVAASQTLRLSTGATLGLLDVSAAETAIAAAAVAAGPA